MGAHRSVSEDLHHGHLPIPQIDIALFDAMPHGRTASIVLILLGPTSASTSAAMSCGACHDSCLLCPQNVAAPVNASKTGIVVAFEVYAHSRRTSASNSVSSGRGSTVNYFT